MDWTKEYVWEPLTLEWNLNEALIRSDEIYH